MSDQSWRFTIFLSSLIFFSVMEFVIPYRKRELKRQDRWPANLLLILLASLTVKVILPSGGLLFLTNILSEKNVGFFNYFQFNNYLSLILSIIILDLSIYVQHIIFHKIKFFWRFHRVHHADIDLDTTSALRFHPIEIIFSIIYKMIIVSLIGASIEAVFIFEVILNFMAMFNHSNILIPRKFESLIRLVFVTPQMHIVHHSVEQIESDTNYGFNLSFWDRLFCTYRENFNSKGIIGQKYFRDRKGHTLLSLISLPFKSN